MRQLHPVSFHEQFVASGTYLYSQDDAATGDIEHWTIHEPGEGALTIRADYDGRAGSGVNWLFEGFYNCIRRRVERFDLSVLGDRRTDAKVSVGADGLHVSLRVDGEAVAPITSALPPDAVALPPALVGAYLFASGAASAVQAVVIDFDPATGIIHGLTQQTLAVEARGAEAIVIDGHTVHTNVLRVVSDTGREVSIWRDQSDVVLRWQDAHGRAAILTQYVHRPEKTP